MRRSRRFRRIFRKVNIFVVVFVAFVNACIYSPIHSLAADSVSDIVPYFGLFCGSSTMIRDGLVVSDTATFQVVKTASSFMPSTFRSSTSTGNHEDYYSSGTISSYELATFQGNLIFRFYFEPDTDLSPLFVDDYLHFSNLKIQVVFRIINSSATGETGSPSDEREHLLDGVFGVPSVINIPNGSIISPRMEKLGTSSYALTLNLVDFSYKRDEHIEIFVPYTCSSRSNSGAYFYDNLDLTIQLDYGENPLSLFVYGEALPGISVNDDVSQNVQDLVDGYDSSSGNQVASDFESGAASYDQAEDNLFNSADSALTGFKFFDFSTFGTITTGLSFVSGIMTSIYNNFGAMQGLGIVLSVLFSVMFMAIVIGFYRYFK